MTRPVNLYLISRIPDPDAFNSVYHHAAEKLSGSRTPIHEIESLRRLVDRMTAENVAVRDLDGFFFSYSIPLIGKEFDLLKFRPDCCLSIELKSQPVPLEQIRAQLLKNRHYLGHLGRSMELFTFISDTGQCFHMDGDVLEPVPASDLAKAVLSFSGDHVSEIDGLFRPSEYIVSPAGTPEKFLNREYFLTQAQEHIRNSLLAALGDTTGLAYFSLTGKPGTGKTLLLYDVGRAIAAQARTAILHWGDLTEGHSLINARNIGLTILPWDALDGKPDGEWNLPADDLTAGTDPDTGALGTDAETAGPAGNAVEDAGDAGRTGDAVEDAGELDPGAGDTGLVLPALAPFAYVLVDEAHRLTPLQFQALCDTAKAYRQRIVFCMDPEQILTTADRLSNIAGRVAQLPLDGSFTLSERLRGNRELLSFIQQIRDLNNKPKTHMEYRDVELGFAGGIDEARSLLAYYRDQGYVFINYYRGAGNPSRAGNSSGADKPETSAPPAREPEQPHRESDNPFAAFEGGYDIHHIIGQEFNRVVLLLDNSFYYTEEGKLEGIPSPDPDILYPNLFYQSITRVQEKLALIVLANEPLFDRIAGILG